MCCLGNLKNDDVVQVYRGKMELYGWKYNIRCALKYARRISQSVCDADKYVKSVMKEEWCFMTVFFANFRLPAHTNRIEREEHCGIVQVFDAFVHTKKRDRVSICQSVNYPVFNTERQCSVLLWYNEYGCGRFCLHCFYQYSFHHFVVFDSFKRPRLRARTIRRRMARLIVVIGKLCTAVCDAYTAGVLILHDLSFEHLFYKFVTILCVFFE